MISANWVLLDRPPTILTCEYWSLLNVFALQYANRS
jgi:hypothetical protein